MTAQQKLADFGTAVLLLLRGNSYCDDQSITDTALELGVLVMKPVATPCGASCICAVVGFTFPTDCCVVAADVQATLPTKD